MTSTLTTPAHLCHRRRRRRRRLVQGIMELQEVMVVCAFWARAIARLFAPV